MRKFREEPPGPPAHCGNARLFTRPTVKLIEILQGKWLGHPLHPAIVHVPLGGWIAACAIDVAVAAGWAHGAFPRLALYCTITGLIGAVLAVPPGIADWAGIKKEKPAWKLALVHMLLNAAATFVWIANLTLRLAGDRPASAAILGTSVIGTTLVLASGYVGSLLVFAHGVSVARLSKPKWRRLAEEGGARLPKES